MSSRELDVGTIVHFLCESARGTIAQYCVQELLFIEDGAVLYRIKSDAEPFDRIVAEGDLVGS